jgi:hypothetical protein
MKVRCRKCNAVLEPEPKIAKPVMFTDYCCYYCGGSDFVHTIEPYRPPVQDYTLEYIRGQRELTDVMYKRLWEALDRITALEGDYKKLDNDIQRYYEKLTDNVDGSWRLDNIDEQITALEEIIKSLRKETNSK